MRQRPAIWTVVLLMTACSEGPGDPNHEPPPTGDAVSLVVAPNALLLAPGETRQLVAYAVDADGDSTAVAATFQSSAPGVVTVTSAGLVTGGSALGSAQIVAQSGTMVSAPVLALRATPAEGALLVSDDKVIGTIVPIDPDASYQPGWRYRVRLRGVTPAAGQVVLASGGAPIGGRVVSVSAVGGDVEVELELIPLAAMFAQLTFHENLSLEHATALIPSALRGSFRLDRQPGGAFRLEARERRMRFAASEARSSFGTARIEREFDLGPFECKAEVPPAFVFPLSVDVFSFELDPDLSYDIAVSDGAFQRAVVTGSLAPRLTASPRITAALEAKAECKVQVATLILPIGGPLALLVSGQVPLGVGFEIGAKSTIGQLGYDALLQTRVTTRFGIDCAAGCEVISSITATSPGSYFKPVLPALGTDVRFELGVSGFGWAELAIGNAVLNALRFKAVELKAGLEQKLELASREAQAADAAYASSFSLKPVLEAKAASNLQAIANLLSINLATLTFAPELPTLAQSPRGTFTISPASVTPANGAQPGTRATFSVLFSDVRYLGIYIVDGVEIRWRKTNGTTVTLAPGRPGCSDLSAADMQMLFTCEADFAAADTGTQTFHAFAKTQIFGVPLPMPLEIAADAKATVLVGGGVTISPASATLAPGESRQFTATVTGSPGATVTWTWTGASGVTTSGNVATYTAGPAGGNFSITATSVQDPSKSAAAAIQITSGSPPPPPPPTGTVVRVIPDSVIVPATQVNFFSAVVTPSAANAVTWSAAGGTITQSSPTSGGLFRAGSEPGTYFVTARSVDDPTATGTAKVIIIANVLGGYTGTSCNTAEAEQICGPVTAAVNGPFVLNGQIYVGFADAPSGGNIAQCRSLARLVSTSGGATLIGTNALVCTGSSAVTGDLNTEGAWNGTLAGNSLSIVDGQGRYTYSLTKTP